MQVQTASVPKFTSRPVRASSPDPGKGPGDSFHSSEPRDTPKMIAKGLVLAALAGAGVAGGLLGGDGGGALAVVPGAALTGGVAAQFLKGTYDGGGGVAIAMMFGGLAGFGAGHLAAISPLAGGLAAAGLGIAGPLGAYLLTANVDWV